MAVAGAMTRNIARCGWLRQARAPSQPFKTPRLRRSTMMTTLAGKTALVTGASRGIGRASAVALARDGAHVIVHYGKGAEEATSVVNEIRTAGGKADAVSADLMSPDSPVKLAAKVKA